MRRFFLAALILAAAIPTRHAQPALANDKKEPAKTEKLDEKKTHLLVVPPAGEEVELADWHFSHGTRRFALMGDAPQKPKTGPEYLEFREEKSTSFQNGILSLIPLTSIRKLDYDREKKTVAVELLKAGDKEETLTGVTKFVGINKITLEGDAILKGLGSATVKFQGGTPEGIRRVRFPKPRAVEPVKGEAATIIALDKEKTPHAVYGVQPLYLVDGGYRILPHLTFKKTVKIDMDKIARLRFVPGVDKKQISSDFEVTLRDGNKHSLTLLTTIELEKKKTMTFVGLVGRVPIGYKLFPPHTFQEFRLTADEEKK